MFTLSYVSVSVLEVCSKKYSLSSSGSIFIVFPFSLGLLERFPEGTSTSMLVCSLEVDGRW